MPIRCCALVITIVLSLTITSASAASPLKDKREKSILKAAQSVAAAITNGDVKAVEHFVGSKGIACNDAVIPKSKVIADLRNNDSWLYTYLFSPERFAEKHKTAEYPMSLRAYLLNSKDLQLRVAFLEKDGKEMLDYGCVRYVSASSPNWPELCFSLQKGGWKFADGPYPCS